MDEEAVKKTKKERLQQFAPIISDHAETNYLEALMHLFKGNLGVGLFAMGEAYKNGGIYVSPVITLLMGVICVHCQHVLLSCTDIVNMEHYENLKRVEYPEAVTLCFTYGPPRLANAAKVMGRICNCFIFVTQIGFCCIYLTVIATNLLQILSTYDIIIDIHYMLLIIWLPIWMTCLITNLKALAPVSILANFCLFTSFIIAMYFALKDGLPSLSERKPYTNPYQFLLCLGTIIFSFEGIAVVLPLKNTMKHPEDFQKPFGVLNMGMVLIISMYLFSGISGYMKWGEDVHDTITLNIEESILGHCTKGLLSLGIMFTYALQFFIPIFTIMPSVLKKCPCGGRKLLCELLLRTAISFATVLIAAAFPNVGIFISLMGGLCSTVLALVFPPVMECLLLQNTIQNSKYLKYFKYFKNCIILMIAFISFTVGTYVNTSEIVKYFKRNNKTHFIE